MDKEIRILSVEDSGADAEMIARELDKGGFAHTTKWVKSKEEFLRALGEFIPDVILCDYKMPSLDAPEALAIVKERLPGMPFIVVSGTIGEDIAVEMMKAGAVDYVMKDRLIRLVPAVKRALEEAQAYVKQKKTEEDLRESKALVDAVIENIPLMIFLKEAKDLRFVILNRAGEELLGYDRKTLLGKNNLNLFPPEQAAHFMAKDREVLDAESGFLDIPEESIATSKKGTRLLHTRKVCVRGTDGNTKFLLGISEDITDRKRAEEASREMAEKFRTIFKNTSDGIIITSLEDLSFYDANESVCNMLGYSLEELKKLSVADIHPKESLGSILEEIEKQSKDVSVPAADLPLKRKDGSIIHANVLGTKMKLSGKNYMVGVFRDITERKKTEEALQESEKRFMDVLYASKDAILLIDGDKFVDCNEATVRMLGYLTRKEFLMTHPSELSPPEQPDGRSSFEKANEMMKLAFEQGFHRFEWIHKKADGTNFPVEVSLTPIAARGKNILHCLWRDITLRKALEEKERKHSQELEVFYKASIGREERILELKKEIEQLKKERGK